MEDKMYIGRTPEYYDYDDENMFLPDFWTWSENKDDSCFGGEVHELTDEGKSELEWWLECKRMNAWQRSHSWGVRNETPEQMWDKLTNSKYEYSIKL